MWCKVFFFSKEKDFEKMINEIKFPEMDIEIITNSNTVQKFFKSRRKQISLFDEIIPDQGTIAHQIYLDAKNVQKQYREILKKINYTNIELFDTFDYQILRQIIFFIKIKKILENKKKYIFIFEGLNSLYLAINEIAKKQNYDIGKILIFEENEIKEVDHEKLNYASKMLQKKSLKKISNIYQRYSKNNSQISNINNFLKIGNRVIRLILKFITLNVLSSKKNSIEKILTNICKKLENDGKPQFLFFITTTRIDLYLKQWYPVFQELSNEGYTYKIITADLATSTILTKEKISFIDIFDDLKILENIIKNSKEGINIIKDLDNLVIKNSEILGISSLSSFLKEMSWKTIVLLTICDEIFQKIKLKSIIACADGEMLENSAIMISKKYNIPSFSMVPAILAEFPVFADWFHADTIFCYGKNDFQMLTKLGYENDRLKICGNPKYDKMLLTNKNEDKKEFLEKYGIPINKKIILIGMSEWHDNDEAWMSELVKFCNKKNIFVVIKIHPKYKTTSKIINENKIKQLNMKLQGLKFLITDNIDMAYLLQISDLYITDYSSVAMEATLLEKPVLNINLDFSERNKDLIRLPLVDEKIAFFVEKYEDLEKKIVEVIDNKIELGSLKEKMRLVIEKYNFPNDGSSSSRILRFLIGS